PVSDDGTSRFADRSPFWGGAGWVGTAAGRTGGCTTGFAMTIDNTPKMLSAGHCLGGPAMTPHGQSIGTVERRNRPQDTLFIRTDNAEARIYPSLGLNQDGTSRRIIGTTWPTIGTYICVSGSASGRRCGGLIEADSVSVYYDSQGYTVEDIVLADGV